MRKRDWQERFWEHVTKLPHGCWEWDGIILDGYGYLNVDNQVRRAPRLSWQLHRGDIPDDLCVLHTCDNRKCVNPEHLYLGTRADNAGDMVERHRSLSGQRNHKAKLDTDQVNQIRSMYKSGKYLQRHLAFRFGVNQQSISHIVTAQTWR
jgi:hypothetical protein